MNRILKCIFLLVPVYFLLSACEEEAGPNLPPVDERVSEAITNLESELIAPENGWKLFYKPTGFSGTFYMTLDFNTDGEVRIKTDLMDNDGEFVDQTIPYRIDNALGLELIFETYGAFHYLFEQNQATFGAEFEWRYLGNQEGNLVFESISDNVDPSRIILVPAEPGDDNLFALELAENLSSFTSIDAPTAISESLPGQQLILEDLGISIFWTLDPTTRFVSLDMIAEGTSFEDVLTNNNFQSISGFSGYTMENNSMIFNDPLSFVVSRQQITIEEIVFDELSQDGQSLCPEDLTNNGLAYSGQVQNIGDVMLTSSHLNNPGAVYLQPNISSINIPFLFDEEDNSLIESGILAERFPSALGFYFINGVELVDENIPNYSFGIVTEDGELLLREFETVISVGNFLRFNLLDSYYSTGGPVSVADSLNLSDVTDEIFSGGDVYSYEFPQNGVFRLFNPCNSYEIFLVQ